GDTGRSPFLLYLHENQFSYPRPTGRPLDRSFAVSHVASLLAADGIALNSRSHRDAMRSELRAFLSEVPPPRPGGCLTRLSSARVLYPGVRLDEFPPPSQRPAGRPPVILWNHRWEEDKRPGAFARALLRLDERGCAFRLVLLGTGEQVQPTPLLLLREKLGPCILRDRPARRGAEYRAWLRRADITVSTAAQENFGYATVEAMAAGAVPLLPRRLSYPELLPRRLADRLLYDSDDDLVDRLETWLEDPVRIERLRRPVMQAARRYSWSRRVKALDDWVADAAARAPGRAAS
ncbi:MAG: glycosyltransferase family 4 protein, partial [Acidobacteriota bacterium]|nr:glycosyltransferase family 4 protein [Acidobacteriota bacterium]